MNKLQRIYYTAAALGWDNVARRVWQLAKGKLGISQRRLPGGALPADELRHKFTPIYSAASVAEHWRRRAERFFFPPAQRASLRAALERVADAATWDEQVTRVVRGLAAGHMPQFSHQWAEVGIPPRFNRDPLHRVDWPTGRHWSTYQQFDPHLADMKCVWEPSRFSWAFTLARDYVRRGDAQIAELYWRTFDAWDEQNPYGLTVNWTCSQEASFRLFAWLFSTIAMLDAPSTTPARLQRVSELAWYTGRHVASNINYALGQKNNHAISEAVALLTIGTLFPELKDAAGWAERGRRVFAGELLRQIYADGSYVQHSLNYHRVMLDDALWGVRLTQLAGQPLPPAALERLNLALDWLLEMIEPTTGGVPNYGANDGALVLPLSTCDYADFRPTAQALHVLLRGGRVCADGPWDESAVWLSGPGAAATEATPRNRTADFAAEQGGYYALSGSRSWGLLRCHSYRDRPGQADMLHFDLWYDGVNILRDAGTFHYFTRPPWQHYFESTAAHNTITVDGADQMERGPRFLWLRWIRSRLLHRACSDDGRVSCVVGEHYGYTRLPGRVVHRRLICRINDAYVIIDDVLGGGRHELTLRWRLADVAWTEQAGVWRGCVGEMDAALQLAGPDGHVAELLRGVETPQPEGWESRYYAEKTPTPVLRVSGMIDLPARFATIVSLGTPSPRIDVGQPDGPARLREVAGACSAAALEAATGGRIGL